MDVLNIGDYCLRFAEITPGAQLPLVRVEGVGTLVSVSNRLGVCLDLFPQDLMKFDSNYTDVLWDELIVIEQQIRFLLRQQEEPENYVFISQWLSIARLDGENFVRCEKDPWIKKSYRTKGLESLPQPRVNQIDSKLTQLEEMHSFVFDALNFAG